MPISSQQKQMKPLKESILKSCHEGTFRLHWTNKILTKKETVYHTIQHIWQRIHFFKWPKISDIYISFLFYKKIFLWYRICQEKAMAPHSSTFAWKIPWAEEPGRLQSMGSRRVRHEWATSLSLFTFMHWRRKRQPTPVFLPGESQGRGSLVGCHLWGHTESDTTEVT